MDNYPDTTWSGDPAAPWNRDDDIFDNEAIEEADPADDALQLSDVEKLAIAQAFYKSVAELVSTKNPDNLRGRVDEHFKQLYESTGAKSFDVRLLGGKVGSFSISTTKKTDEKTSTEFEVEDDEAFSKWVVENKYFQIDWNAIKSHFDLTGEVPEGCKPVTVVTPGLPGGEFKSTTLRIDADAVLSTLGPQLETVSYMLLEGGE